MLGFKSILSKIIIKYLNQKSILRSKKTTNNPRLLKAALRPGDVLLVEGNQRFSTAVKYFTQSNWSHAALYTGPLPEEKYGTSKVGAKMELIEADIEQGVRVIPLSTYYKYHTRICRPRGISENETEIIINYCLSKIGAEYDMKNILDLAHYLFPFVPIPTRFRRDILELGSGDPTKAICSSLIAEAFQLIDYPILPMKREGGQHRKRHPSVYVPSDFDRSPYFEIIKPTLMAGFNHKEIDWLG